MDEPTLADLLVEQAQDIARELGELPLDERIETLNRIRAEFHRVSPFKDEPVDFVQWVASGRIYANSYNPNHVAPQELELLRISIREDGFTQPVVCHADEDDTFEIVDGYHRSLTGRKAPLNRRLYGYLPVTQVAGSDLASRMAATVRHNRARGKHRVQSMTELVASMEREGVDRAAIARALGMDAEEMLRLTRHGGAAAALAGASYSQAWEAQEDE